MHTEDPYKISNEALAKVLETETHIDDWLDTPTEGTGPEAFNTTYAKFVLEFARMPAWKKTSYLQWTQQFELYCTHKGKRYRVNGASRMGDVWLCANFSKDFGYDLRVMLDECSAWSPTP